MPRSREEIIQHAEALAKRFERYEPNPDDERDVAGYQLRRAAIDRARSERDLAEAVEEARRAGLTWRQIAETMGITSQAAQQRYGRSA
jgi:hypothetical protein